MHDNTEDKLKELISLEKDPKNTVESFFSYFNGQFSDHIYDIMEKTVMQNRPTAELCLEFAKKFTSYNMAKSVAFMEKYVELNGNDEYALIFFAKLYKQTNQPEKALKVLLSFSCDSEEYLYEKFYICMILKRYDDAFYIAEEIIKKYSYIHTEKNEVAELYIKQAKYEELIKNINENVIKNIDDKYKNYYLCKIYDLKNDKILKFERLENLIEFYDDTVIKEFINEQIYKEINENWYYNDNVFLIKLLDILCRIIVCDDENYITIKTLAYILRKQIFDVSLKEKITDKLSEYQNKAKTLRAGNIFLNEIEILKRETVLKSHPREITVELTNKCNLKCPMCCVFNRSDYDISENLYNFLKSNIPYLEQVIWQGGEVFLHKKFEELLKFAGEYHVKQYILTNGLLLNDKWIELLYKYNVSVKISIDSLDKDVYEQIRIGGKFEDLINIVGKLNSFKKNNPDFKYIMAVVLTQKNSREIERFVNFAVDNGFECICFQKYEPNDSSFPIDGQFLIDEKQSEEFFEKMEYLRNTNKDLKIETNFTHNDLIKLFNRLQYRQKHPPKCEDEEKKLNKFIIPEHIDKLCCKSNENQLFCLSPWTRIYLDVSALVRITCNSSSIKAKNYSGEDIWNCKEMVSYRDCIVKGYTEHCRTACLDSGSYGERIKLGTL